MKKIISLIVISVMLLSALAMNVGAADTFTKEDAEKLFQNTYELYHSIQNSIYYENGAKRAWIGCEWYDYNDFTIEICPAAIRFAVPAKKAENAPAEEKEMQTV